MSYTDAFLYASGLVIVNAVSLVVTNHYYATGWLNGMKVRVAVCSMIYRKVNFSTFSIYSIDCEFFFSFKKSIFS